MKRDIYQEVTDTILRQLEAGTPPWRQPWNAGAAHPFTLPVNGTTGRGYNGVNIPLLWGSAHERAFLTHEWASFKQWQAAGHMVRKGEKGTPIVFYSTFEREREGSEDVDRIPFVRLSYVFNRCQLEGWVAPVQEGTTARPVIAALDHAEAFVQATGAVVHHGGGRAFYRPSADTVHMPERDTFENSEAYYATLLHELSHWTGAEHRLARTLGKRFGDNAYAMEELVAELSAAFLCASLGITDTPRADHASYLAHWVSVMKQDKRAILTAASAASKAADYLHGLQDADRLPPAPASVPMIGETMNRLPA